MQQLTGSGLRVRFLTNQLEWKHKQHPRRDTGVDGPCPLAKVPLFNLVWDVCMDFMHIVKVLISGHLFPVLKSQRGLSAPQVKVTEANNAEVNRYASHGYNRGLTVIIVNLTVLTVNLRL